MNTKVISSRRSKNISSFVALNREKFQSGVILFNAGEFFKAHEAWEEIWLAAPESEKAFLQGLIQLAAAFHHYSRGNRAGMNSLVAAALEKLEKFPDIFCGINLAALRRASREWLATPQSHPACVPVPIPKIQPA